MKFLKAFYKFLNRDRLSVVDLISAGLLTQWAISGATREFFLFLGFLVVAGLTEAAVNLSDDAQRLRDLEKMLRRMVGMDPPRPDMDVTQNEKD